MKKNKIYIYLASPYGFTDAGREFMNNVFIPNLSHDEIEVLNPWNSFKSAVSEIEKISLINDKIKLARSLGKFNYKIASHNEELIDKSQFMIAILDGSDVDSGVAAEIGYAYANKKTIIGYRSDFRSSGDNFGAVVNIQVEYFVEKSGGRIVNNISALNQVLKKLISLK
jgi:nucleoside 2-deoxyribosyltransferase